MRGAVLLDAGPLVALLDRSDRFHEWARGQLARFTRALLTCEAVLAEATDLLRTLPGGGRAVLGLLDRGVLAVPFRLEENVPSVSKLMTKYANLPMSLADGCLVRMAELHDDGVVMTLDRDFRIYRKNGRNIIPTIMPDELDRESGTECPIRRDFLVPTLRVGMPSSTLRVGPAHPNGDAERPGRYSHAERGNEKGVHDVSDSQ